MFVIKWCNSYIIDLSARMPFTMKVADAKKWKTLKNAERYLSRKDKGFRDGCTIVEVGKEE